jgi:hypothetical protein
MRSKAATVNPHKRAKLIYRDSLIYETWFNYLRASEAYKRTCDAKGRRGLIDLYKDWGDIYSVEFREWYRSHREYLFGEPKPAAVSLLEAGERVPTNSITISIPVSVSRAWALRRSQRIIKAKFAVKVGGLKESLARYPVTRAPNVASLRRQLFVHQVSQQIDSATGKPFKLHQIAKMDKVGLSKSFKPHAETQVWQMKKRALEVIDAVEHGQFPTRIDKRTQRSKRTSAAR